MLHLNTKDNLDKFSSKTDEGIFLGYFTSSKAYRVFNKKTLVIEESMYVVLDEVNPFSPINDVSYDNDIVSNLDELILEDPQLSEDQAQLKEDPLKTVEDEVELQEKQV